MLRPIEFSGKNGRIAFLASMNDEPIVRSAQTKAPATTRSCLQPPCVNLGQCTAHHVNSSNNARHAQRKVLLPAKALMDDRATPSCPRAKVFYLGCSNYGTCFWTITTDLATLCFGVGLQPTVPKSGLELVAQFLERFQTDGDAQQIGLHVEMILVQVSLSLLLSFVVISSQPSKGTCFPVRNTIHPSATSEDIRVVTTAPTVSAERKEAALVRSMVIRCDNRRKAAAMTPKSVHSQILGRCWPLKGAYWRNAINNRAGQFASHKSGRPSSVHVVSTGVFFSP
jgi:hypothetical protein